MANTPQFKIYNGKEYVAACKYAEDAAALVAVLGDYAEVRHGHSTIVWREGWEKFSAGQSYDAAADLMRNRIAEAHQRLMEKLYDVSAQDVARLCESIADNFKRASVGQ